MGRTQPLISMLQTSRAVISELEIHWASSNTDRALTALSQHWTKTGLLLWQQTWIILNVNSPEVFNSINSFIMSRMLIHSKLGKSGAWLNCIPLCIHLTCETASYRGTSYFPNYHSIISRSFQYISSWPQCYLCGLLHCCRFEKYEKVIYDGLHRILPLI